MSLEMAERETGSIPGIRPRDSKAGRPGPATERTVDELLVAYHRDGDRNARDQVLVELMPLVRSLAARYAGRGEPLDDLVQVGVRRPDQGGRPVRRVAGRRVHELRRPDDRR